jgi:hypothetical protein
MGTWIGMAIVAIGLIWSVATMLELVPVNSAEMRSAAITQHVTTMRQSGSPSAD